MSDWRQPHEVWIVGHRGAPRRGRENTIDSLDWAESLGVDAVEFDLRQTRDGEAVLFHDEQIQLGNQHLPVRSFTAREIEKLVLSSEFGDYRIPRLEEVFHRYGNALRYLVEVKVAPSTQRLIMARRIAHLASVFGVRIVASWRRSTRRSSGSCARRTRRSRRAFSSTMPVALPEPGRPTPLFPAVDAIGPARQLVTAALMEQAARAGLSVHPWTADEDE